MLRVDRLHVCGVQPSLCVFVVPNLIVGFGSDFASVLASEQVDDLRNIRVDKCKHLIHDVAPIAVTDQPYVGLCAGGVATCMRSWSCCVAFVTG